MVWLNHGLAGFRLFTLDERSEELTEIDYRDAGNVESRLVHAFRCGRQQSSERRSGVARV